MEVGDAEAQPAAGLESTGRCVHADCGRRKGIVGREVQRAPVLAAVVGCVWWAGDDVVPF